MPPKKTSQDISPKILAAHQRLKEAGIDIPLELAADFDLVTRTESGRSHFTKNGKVKLGKETPWGRAIGFSQIMPGTAAALNPKLDPFKETDNIALGLQYFARPKNSRVANDPIARRLHYLGGPGSKALKTYLKTGQVSRERAYSYSDSPYTYDDYVRQTGGYTVQKDPTFNARRVGAVAPPSAAPTPDFAEDYIPFPEAETVEAAPTQQQELPKRVPPRAGEPESWPAPAPFDWGRPPERRPLVVGQPTPRTAAPGFQAPAPAPGASAGAAQPSAAPAAPSDRKIAIPQQRPGAVVPKTPSAAPAAPSTGTVATSDVPFPEAQQEVAEPAVEPTVQEQVSAAVPQPQQPQRFDVLPSPVPGGQVYADQDINSQYSAFLGAMGQVDTPDARQAFESTLKESETAGRRQFEKDVEQWEREQGPRGKVPYSETVTYTGPRDAVAFRDWFIEQQVKLYRRLAPDLSDFYVREEFKKRQVGDIATGFNVDTARLSQARAPKAQIKFDPALANELRGLQSIRETEAEAVFAKRRRGLPLTQQDQAILDASSKNLLEISAVEDVGQEAEKRGAAIAAQYVGQRYEPWGRVLSPFDANLVAAIEMGWIKPEKAKELSDAEAQRFEQEIDNDMQRPISKKQIAGLFTFGVAAPYFMDLPSATREESAAKLRDLLEAEGVTSFGELDAKRAELARQEAARQARIRQRATENPMYMPNEVVRRVGYGLAGMLPAAIEGLASTIDASPGTRPIADFLLGLGDDVRKKIETEMVSLDADLGHYAAFNAIPSAVGQLIGQIAISMANPRLGVAVAFSQGAGEPYKEARKAGSAAAPYLGIVGGLAAIPDAIMASKYIAPLLKGTQKLGFVDKLITSFTAKAASEVGEKRALEMARELLKGMMRSGYLAGKAGLMEGAQEVSENKINDIAAKLSYDPKRKIMTWTDADAQAAAAGFIAGVFGMGVGVGAGRVVRPEGTTFEDPTKRYYEAPDMRDTAEYVETPQGNGYVVGERGDGTVVVSLNNLGEGERPQVFVPRENIKTIRAAMERSEVPTEGAAEGIPAETTPSWIWEATPAEGDTFTDNFIKPDGKTEAMTGTLVPDSRVAGELQEQYDKAPGVSGKLLGTRFKVRNMPVNSAVKRTWTTKDGRTFTETGTVVEDDFGKYILWDNPSPYNKGNIWTNVNALSTFEDSIEGAEGRQVVLRGGVENGEGVNVETLAPILPAGTPFTRTFTLPDGSQFAQEQEADGEGGATPTSDLRPIKGPTGLVEQQEPPIQEQEPPIQEQEPVPPSVAPVPPPITPISQEAETISITETQLPLTDRQKRIAALRKKIKPDMPQNERLAIERNIRAQEGALRAAAEKQLADAQAVLAKKPKDKAAQAKAGEAQAVLDSLAPPVTEEVAPQEEVPPSVADAVVALQAAINKLPDSPAKSRLADALKDLQNAKTDLDIMRALHRINTYVGSRNGKSAGVTPQVWGTTVKPIKTAAANLTLDMAERGYEFSGAIQVGQPYTDGLKVEVKRFEDDPTLPPGTSVISTVLTPAINKDGKMTQSGVIVVKRNEAGAETIAEAVPAGYEVDASVYLGRRDEQGNYDEIQGVLKQQSDGTLVVKYKDTGVDGKRTTITETFSPEKWAPTSNEATKRLFVSEGKTFVSAPQEEQAAPQEDKPTLTPISYEDYQNPDENGNPTIGQAEVVKFEIRPIVLVDINGVKVPFYISTGEGGKAETVVGQWYPFFGIDKSLWFNKTDGKDMAEYYGSPKLKAAAEWLNANIGDVRNTKLPTADYESAQFLKAVNQDMDPVPNEPGSIAPLMRNIDQILTKIGDKAYFKLPASQEGQAAPAEEPQVSTDPKAVNAAFATAIQEAKTVAEAKAAVANWIDGLKGILQKNGLLDKRMTGILDGIQENLRDPKKTTTPSIPTVDQWKIVIMGSVVDTKLPKDVAAFLKTAVAQNPAIEALAAAETPVTEEADADTLARIRAFNDLANKQREAPEEAMKEVQRFHGGVLNPIVEAVGDLINRMTSSGGVTPNPDATMDGHTTNRGWGYVASKLETALNKLNDPYFMRRHEENVRNNAQAKKQTAPEYQAALAKLMNAYADAHAALPVYNKVQELARAAAVALGRQDFDAARTHLEALNKLATKGKTQDAQERNWAKEANKFDPDYTPTIELIGTETAPAEQEPLTVDFADDEGNIVATVGEGDTVYRLNKNGDYMMAKGEPITGVIEVEDGVLVARYTYRGTEYTQGIEGGPWTVTSPFEPDEEAAPVEEETAPEGPKVTEERMKDFTPAPGEAPVWKITIGEGADARSTFIQRSETNDGAGWFEVEARDSVNTDGETVRTYVDVSFDKPTAPNSLGTTKQEAIQTLQRRPVKPAEKAAPETAAEVQEEAPKKKGKKGGKKKEAAKPQSPTDIWNAISGMKTVSKTTLTDMGISADEATEFLDWLRARGAIGPRSKATSEYPVRKLSPEAQAELEAIEQGLRGAEVEAPPVGEVIDRASTTTYRAGQAPEVGWTSRDAYVYVEHEAQGEARVIGERVVNGEVVLTIQIGPDTETVPAVEVTFMYAVERGGQAMVEYNDDYVGGGTLKMAAPASSPVEGITQEEIDQVPLETDVKQQLLAPNGKPSELPESLWRTVRTPAFIRWAGDWINDPANATVLLNPTTGEPQVFYHGTTQSFDTFQKNKRGSKTLADDAKQAFFFTDDPNVAGDYVGYIWVKGPDGQPMQWWQPGGNIMPVFLRADNPVEWDWDKALYDGPRIERILKQAKADKAGGVTFENMRDPSVSTVGSGKPSTIVAIFNPNDIKSVFNIGTFSEKPSILKMARATPPTPVVIAQATSDLRDQQYEQAVAAGDMETAQRLVNEAAAEAGYTVGPVFHYGTFDPDAASVLDTINGVHFGTFKASMDLMTWKTRDAFFRGVVVEFDEVSQKWNWRYDYPAREAGEPSPIPLEAGQDGFLTKGEAYRDVNDFIDDYVDNIVQRVIDGWGTLTSVFLNPADMEGRTDHGQDWSPVVADTRPRGINLVWYRNRYEDQGSKSYMVLDPTVAKSAAPATYDDDGNLIPLSQRFDRTSASIRKMAKAQAEAKQQKQAKRSAFAKANIKKAAIEQTEVGAKLNNQAAQVVEFLFAQLFNDNGAFYGAFLEGAYTDQKGNFTKAKTDRLINGLKDAAAQFKGIGERETAAKLLDMARSVMKARMDDGSSIIYIDDKAVNHEYLHYLSFALAVDKSLEGRHDPAMFKKLKKHPAVQKAWDAFFGRRGNNFVTGQKTRPMIPGEAGRVIEEMAIYSADGMYDTIGLTQDEANDFLRMWFESYAKKNGKETLDKFAEKVKNGQEIIQEVRQKLANLPEPSGARQSLSDFSEDAASRLTERDTDLPGAAEAQNAQLLKMATGKTPDGKVTPKELRAKGVIPAEDRQRDLVGVSTFGRQQQMAEADKILNLGYEAAATFINSTLESRKAVGFEMSSIILAGFDLVRYMRAKGDVTDASMMEAKLYKLATEAGRILEVYKYAVTFDESATPERIAYNYQQIMGEPMPKDLLDKVVQAHKELVDARRAVKNLSAAEKAAREAGEALDKEIVELEDAEAAMKNPDFKIDVERTKTILDKYYNRRRTPAEIKEEVGKLKKRQPELKKKVEAMAERFKAAARARATDSVQAIDENVLKMAAPGDVDTAPSLTPEEYTDLVDFLTVEMDAQLDKTTPQDFLKMVNEMFGGGLDPSTVASLHVDVIANLRPQNHYGDTMPKNLNKNRRAHYEAVDNFASGMARDIAEQADEIIEANDPDEKLLGEEIKAANKRIAALEKDIEKLRQERESISPTDAKKKEKQRKLDDQIIAMVADKARLKAAVNSMLAKRSPYRRVIIKILEQNHPNEAVVLAALKRTELSADQVIQFLQKDLKLNRAEALKVLAEVEKVWKRAQLDLQRERLEAKMNRKLNDEEVRRIQAQNRAAQNTMRERAKSWRDIDTAVNKTTSDQLGDAFVNFGKASLLFHPLTHEINLIGNGIEQVTDSMVNILATPMDIAFAKAISGQRSTTLNLKGVATGFLALVAKDPTFAAAVKARRRATEEDPLLQLDDLEVENGLQMAKNILWYGDSKDELAQLNLGESNLRLKFEGDKSKGVVQRSQYAAAWIIDQYINKNFQLLQAEDALFKAYTFRKAMEELATIQAKNEVASGKADVVTKTASGTVTQTPTWQQRKAEILQNPTATMAITAQYIAEELTFQNDNIISAGIRAIKSRGINSKYLTARLATRGVDLIMPFERTPTNILIKQLETSPLGFARAAEALMAYLGTRVPSIRRKFPFEGKRDRLRKVYFNAIHADLMMDAEATGFDQLTPEEQKLVMEEVLDKLFAAQAQRGFVKATARASIGTATWATGYYLAALGIMYGMAAFDADDREEREMFFSNKMLGTDPGSVGVGGYRYTLPQAPMTRSMAYGAMFFDEWRRQMKYYGNDNASAFAGTSFRYLQEQAYEAPPFRAGFDLWKLTSSPGGFTGNMAFRYVPFSRLLASYAEVMDDTQRRKSALTESMKKKLPEDQKGIGDRFAIDLQNTLGSKLPYFREKGLPGMAPSLPLGTGALNTEERGGRWKRFWRELDPLDIKRDRGMAGAPGGLTGPPKKKQVGKPVTGGGLVGPPKKP